MKGFVIEPTSIDLLLPFFVTNSMNIDLRHLQIESTRIIHENSIEGRSLSFHGFKLLRLSFIGKEKETVVDSLQNSDFFAFSSSNVWSRKMEAP